MRNVRRSGMLSIIRLMSSGGISKNLPSEDRFQADACPRAFDSAPEPHWIVTGTYFSVMVPGHLNNISTSPSKHENERAEKSSPKISFSEIWVAETWRFPVELSVMSLTIQP